MFNQRLLKKRGYGEDIDKREGKTVNGGYHN